MGKSKEKKSKRTPGEFNLRIKMINDEPDQKTSPIIGYFPSGYDPLKYSKDPDSKSDPGSSVKVYKRVHSQNPRNPRMQVVVGASGSPVNFVGTSYSGEATTPQLCNYALGVLDKETGVLKMVPIAGNRIFRLEPRVAGIETVVEDEEDITKENRDAKQKALTSMYATKRNKRRDAKRETLRQTEEPGMQDNNLNLPEIIINKDAVGDVGRGKYARDIPPYDEEATSPEMAYPLDKIITKGDWVHLRDIFELIESGSDLDPNTYPSFVCNRVHMCEAIKDDLKRERMAAILSYITYLIKYKDKHSMDGVSYARHHWIPSVLSQRFSSMFGTTQNERLPEGKQKLLIHYVLVLSLSFDGYKSNPTDIAKDLRINALSLRDYYKYLGCKFVMENKVMLATLSVPLQFETLKRKRRRN